MGVWPLNGVNRGALKESFSDILYRVRLKGKSTDLYLSLLIEHKSYQDPYVTIQMGHYIFSALHRQVLSKETPVPVIPVLFYHGEGPMPYHTHRSLYDAWDEEVRTYVPEYAYIYHDLQQSSVDELLGLRIKYLKSMFLAMKYARDQDMLIRQAGHIFGYISDEDRNFYKPFFLYFFSLVNQKAKLMEAIQHIPEPIQHEAGNAYEELILEGMTKGIEKGIEKGARQTLVQSVTGFFENKVSIKIIAKSLDISEKEVRSILRESGLNVEE